MRPGWTVPNTFDLNPFINTHFHSLCKNPGLTSSDSGPRLVSEECVVELCTTALHKEIPAVREMSQYPYCTRYSNCGLQYYEGTRPFFALGCRPDEHPSR